MFIQADEPSADGMTSIIGWDMSVHVEEMETAI
jgi:hypothetical protein